MDSSALTAVGFIHQFLSIRTQLFSLFGVFDYFNPVADAAIESIQECSFSDCFIEKVLNQWKLETLVVEFTEAFQDTSDPQVVVSRIVQVLKSVFPIA